MGSSIVSWIVSPGDSLVTLSGTSSGSLRPWPPVPDSTSGRHQVPRGPGGGCFRKIYVKRPQMRPQTVEIPHGPSNMAKVAGSSRVSESPRSGPQTSGLALGPGKKRRLIQPCPPSAFRTVARATGASERPRRFARFAYNVCVCTAPAVERSRVSPAENPVELLRLPSAPVTEGRDSVGVPADAIQA